MGKEAEFKNDLLGQKLEIPYSMDTEIYKKPLVLYGKKLPNRIGIQPLEGFDSESDGSPSPYVYRRYLRFVSGGAGLIWFEACAVSEDGKCNPCQMMLNGGNVQAFKELLTAMDNKAYELGREPSFKVLQLTHSGRMSKNGSWEEIALSPKKRGDDDIACIASDDKIAQIVTDHINAAKLAAEAGFDAVDIKVCHGYFLSELLSAFNREGRYGGSFENRTRALFEIIDGIREQIGDKIGICVRLNAYDSEAYPDGYGIVSENGKLRADLSETVLICELLKQKGVELVDISASAPGKRLFGPEPTDNKYRKYSVPCDLLMAVKLLKEKVKDVCFMCTGLSSFGEYGGYVGAGGIEDGWFDIAGFGRQALAYPEFASDILDGHGMDAQKCCINCDGCYGLMAPEFSGTGCIVRDREEILLSRKNKGI